MKIEHEMLIASVNEIIFNSPVKEFNDSEFEMEKLFNFYGAAVRYDLCPIASEWLNKRESKVDKRVIAKFNSHLFTALSRHENRIESFNTVYELFKSENISLMPLKGLVICNYYSEPFLRTSCDIDILIKSEDVKRVEQIVKEKLGYKYLQRSTHDICFETEFGLHVEFHFSLIEGCEHQRSEKILQKVWESAKTDDGVLYEMDANYFYFYIVSHVAKHFYNGGCGIRPLIDIALMNKDEKYDMGVINQLLTESGLKAFYDAIVKLANVWFNEGEYDPLLEQIEEYIFSAGCFGSLENFVAIKRRKQSGIKYFFSRLFIPYDRLKRYYPSLEGKKWLLPFYQIRHWFAVVFSGRLGRSVREVKISSNADKEKLDQLSSMFNKLEL